MKSLTIAPTLIRAGRRLILRGAVTIDTGSPRSPNPSNTGNPNAFIGRVLPILDQAKW